MNKERDYVIGSGNVFADIGVRDPDEALAKAELVRRISLIVEQGEFTQAQVARILGIDRPMVSALLDGKLGDFPLERLLYFLIALDRDVEIVVSPKRQVRGRLSVAVS